MLSAMSEPPSVLVLVAYKRLQRTRHERASLLSCVGVGEPLKRNVMRLLWSSDHLIIPNVKVRDLIKLLSEDGWYLARTKGSDRQFKHQLKIWYRDGCWQGEH
jgi:hypothetical protein